MSAYSASPRNSLVSGVEVRVEAEAGVMLADSSPWWGTRIYWRRPPARRWEKALLLHVHPFDSDALEAFMRRQLGLAAEAVPA